MKPILNTGHAIVKWIAHVILIPFIAVLKAVEAFTGHLLAELTKA